MGIRKKRRISQLFQYAASVSRYVQENFFRAIEHQKGNLNFPAS